jgi:hypothetical protein
MFLLSINLVTGEFVLHQLNIIEVEKIMNRVEIMN